MFVNWHQNITREETESLGYQYLYGYKMRIADFKFDMFEYFRNTQLNDYPTIQNEFDKLRYEDWKEKAEIYEPKRKFPFSDEEKQKKDTYTLTYELLVFFAKGITYRTLTVALEHSDIYDKLIKKEITSTNIIKETFNSIEIINKIFEFQQDIILYNTSEISDKDKSIFPKRRIIIMDKKNSSQFHVLFRKCKGFIIQRDDLTFTAKWKDDDKLITLYGDSDNDSIYRMIYVL